MLVVIEESAPSVSSPPLMTVTDADVPTVVLKVIQFPINAVIESTVASGVASASVATTADPLVTETPEAEREDAVLCALN